MTAPAKPDRSGTLGAEDYKSRTGFVPENIDQLQGGGAGVRAPGGSGSAAGNVERMPR